MRRLFIGNIMTRLHGLATGREKRYSMLNDNFNSFTNRQEIIALFQQLYERDPRQPLPLLPILLLLAPAGGGVSTLIDFLVERSTSTLTYAHIDFAQGNNAITLPELLQDICDQLWQSDNPHLKKITFPRSEPAISAMLEPVIDTNSREIRKQIEQRVSKGLPIYEHIDDLLNVLSNWLPPVTLLLVLCKWVLKGLESHFSPLRELMWGPATKWYKKSYRSHHLTPPSSTVDALIWMRQWYRPGEPRKRHRIVETLLVNAFLEDLREAFDKKRTRYASERTAFPILFFDNFDIMALQNGAGQTLLELLLKSRIEGNTDPLLVIVGSHQRLSNPTDPQQNPAFEWTDGWNEQQKVEHILHHYHQWQERSQKRQFEATHHLFLPLWLYDFDLKETTTYLLRVVGQGYLSSFGYTTLAEDVHAMTHGHPLALKLVTDALQAARIQGRELLPHKTWEEPVSSDPMHIADYEQKTVETYLLSVLLYQLSPDEQEQLVDLAAPAPGTLDLATLKSLLDFNDKKNMSATWERYSKLCILRVYDGETIVFHPLVRDLLTRRLIAKSTARKNYYKVIHSNLREYFSELAASSSRQEQVHKAHVGSAYHALALGDPEPAISLLCRAFIQEDTRWQYILDSITQASTVHVPANAEQQAMQALSAARSSTRESEQQRRNAVTALVLYSWLLNAPDNSIGKRIELWYALGETYRCLPAPDRQICLQISEHHFENAYAAKMENASLLKSLPPLSPANVEPFSVRKKRKIFHNIQIAASILLVCTILASYFTIYYGTYANTACNPSSVFSPQSVLKSTIFSYGIGMTRASDGECIGVSDGPTSFDPDNPDPTEVSIYQEDERILSLWRSDPHRYAYVTVVLLTTVTSRPEDIKSAAKGRADLQGAYIAQIEHNKLWLKPLLRLLVANTGGNSQYAPLVANQIVDAAHNDPSIVAVLGPTQSRTETFEATKISDKCTYSGHLGNGIERQIHKFFTLLPSRSSSQ